MVLYVLSVCPSGQGYGAEVDSIVEFMQEQMGEYSGITIRHYRYAPLLAYRPAEAHSQ